MNQLKNCGLSNLFKRIIAFPTRKKLTFRKRFFVDIRKAILNNFS